MKSLLRTATLITLACVALGCASIYNSAKKAEYAAAVLSDASMKGYAAWWKDATNQPAYYKTTFDALMIQRSNVLVQARRVGASLTAVDSLLEIMKTNPAAKPQMVQALSAATTESTALATTINTLTNR